VLGPDGPTANARYRAGVRRLLRDEWVGRLFNLTMGGLLAGSILLFIH